TIYLAPGTYHPTTTLEVFRSVTVAGEPGKPAPLIEATGTFGLFMQESFSAVRDIRIHSPLGTYRGLAIGGVGSVIERVESTGEANAACVFTGDTVRDSLCASEFGSVGGEGVLSFFSGPSADSFETTLVNVTAIGGSVGISVEANESSSVSI